MKSKTAFLSLIILILLLSACTPAATPPPSPNIAVAPRAAADSAGGQASSSKVANEAVAAQQPAAVNRLVIKNADLTILVSDPAAGMTAIMEMANQMGGYIVSSKSYKISSENGIEIPQASVSVRIPADKLDEALVKIRKLTADPAKDVRTENVTGKDVTADYVDLTSRLTNLQNTEKQMQRIQDSATKTDDVLAVFNKLTEVRGQIEQTKGQIKYYEESAAMSSVSVQLLSKEGVAPLTVGGWEPVGIVRDAFQTLINIGKGLVEVAIWLVIVILPIGLIFYLPGRWIWRKVKKNFANKPAPIAYSNMPPMQPYAVQPPANQPPQPGPTDFPAQ